MTSLTPRIALLICILLTTGVVFNALCRQPGHVGLQNGASLEQATLVVEDRTIEPPEGASGSLPQAAFVDGKGGGGTLDLSMTDPARDALAEPVATSGTGTGSEAAADAKLVGAIQRELASRGYEPGPADGVPTLVTRAAIMAFESDSRRPLTAEPSERLFQALLLGTEPSAMERSAPAPWSRQAARVIAETQRMLLQLGFDPGPTNGRMSDLTQSAMRRFERAEGLPIGGNITGPLVGRLLHRSGLRVDVAESGAVR